LQNIETYTKNLPTAHDFESFVTAAEIYLKMQRI